MKKRCGFCRRRSPSNGALSQISPRPCRHWRVRPGILDWQQAPACSTGSPPQRCLQCLPTQLPHVHCDSLGDSMSTTEALKVAVQEAIDQRGQELIEVATT